MQHQLFKITQNAIIKDKDGAVLILKHTTGNWLLPGGKIQKGETWREGLAREIKEETGISNFDIDHIVDIDSWIEGEEGFYVVTFSAAVSEAEIILSNEHSNYAWVKLADLDNYNFWHENIKKRIVKSLS